MRKTAYVVMVLTVATVAFLAGSLHTARQGVSAASAEDRTPLYYQCPMHPTYKSHAPGTAPCCGMQLEPVYADTAAAVIVASDAAPGSIVVSHEKQQLAGVRVAAVERAGGVERLRLFGRVAAEETRVFTVNVGLDGYIRDLAAVTTGSRVRKDQWLATFATPEARQPIAAYVQTLDVLDKELKLKSGPQQVAAAEMSRQLAVDRLLTYGMSPLQLDEIRRTRVIVTTIKITSPADGIVLTRNVSANEKLERGMELFRVADLRRVWIEADVPAADAQAITPGLGANLVIAGRATPLPARVSRDVLPQFDPSTQSMKIRLEAENPDFVLRPDMFVDVDLEVPYATAVLIPADAVLTSGRRSSVFVERSAGVFEPRDVVLGRRLGNRIAIERGLEPFERVAVSGTFLLDSESRMKSHDQPHH
jgi:Cu(I)/Ag(I) efflux system membrane fusion protein